VPSVEWKWPAGRKKTRLSRTINFAVRLVELLRALLLEIFQLTSLKHLENLPIVKWCADVGSRDFFLKIILLTSLNLPVVEMCADHLWS
jgi:hypothetical protein